MYIYIYMFVWYVRIPYICIVPHLCAMQYFHIACCSTAAHETRLARQNSGDQRNRDLKMVGKGGTTNKMETDY